MRRFLIGLAVIVIWITPTFSSENPLKDLKLEVTLMSKEVKAGDSVHAQIALINVGADAIKACISEEGLNYDFRGAHTAVGGFGLVVEVDHPACTEHFSLNAGEVYRTDRIITIPKLLAGSYKIISISLPILDSEDCGVFGCKRIGDVQSSSEPSLEIVENSNVESNPK